MKVLFVASECAPFAKTGGLADVVAALPQELVRSGADVRVMMPLYREVADKWRDQLTHRLYFYVNLGWRRQYCGIEELQYNGITYYFIDNEYYFNRPSLYGYGNDEGERYAFFCRGILESLPLLDFAPDIIHCHDWQTGMVPPLLKEQYEALPFYRDIRTVMTIHNLQYQGVYGIDYVEEMLGFGYDKYTADKLEFFGCCSFMKAGLTYCDEITTVSPNYAQEIQTPYYGERLDGLISARADRLSGVLNGIDVNEWNPAKDPLIYQEYNQVTRKKRKAYNKECLQKDLGLHVDPDVPLIGMVTRLSPQKGLDLVERVLSEIMEDDVQFVVLGKGDDKFVNFLSWAAWRFDGQVAVRIEMNETLAHRIYASCDMLLMPSQFEPCGLSQMIAMRYGTVPIARETGGLRDTVLSYNKYTDEGNGFTFFNYNAHDMLQVVKRALRYFREHKNVWDTLVKRGMKGDYTWGASAKRYLEIYQAAIDHPYEMAKPPVPDAPPAPIAAVEAEPIQEEAAQEQPAPDADSETQE